MERAVYCIVEGRGGWVIRLNGKDFGPSPTQDVAVDVAKRAALKAHGRGYHAHVMVHEGRRFRSVWMNGREVGLATA